MAGASFLTGTVGLPGRGCVPDGPERSAGGVDGSDAGGVESEDDLVLRGDVELEGSVVAGELGDGVGEGGDGDELGLCVEAVSARRRRGGGSLPRGRVGCVGGRVRGR